MFERHQPLGFLRDTHYYGALLVAPLGWGLYAFLVDASIALESPQAQEFALAVLLYPILEEIVFRAGLQHLLQKRLTSASVLYGVSQANVLTSILFAAAHLVRHSTPTAALVFLPSLVFGYFYDRYGRVLPCIVLHGFYNSGVLFLVIGR